MENTVNKNVFFDCSTHGKYGTTERARLVINGEEISHGSYSWSNRPWQSFDYDIAMTKAFNNAKHLSKHYKTIIKQFLANGGKREEKRVKEMFKTVGMVASLGEVFTTNQKDKNDWKTRMLKAGLTGLEIPEDWENLTENEKEERLNKIINFIKE